MSQTRRACGLLFTVLPALAGCGNGRSSPATVPPAEETRSDGSPAWSPAGSRLAFLLSVPYTRTELHVMDADGSDRRLLLSAYSLSEPAWSPEGSWIAVSSSGGFPQEYHPPFPEAVSGAHEIYLVAADGGTTRRLTNNDYPDGSPAWAPDGTRLAYDRVLSWHFFSDAIYVTDTSGTSQVRLAGSAAPGEEETASDPDWSPDGTRIAYESSGEIRAANADGSGSTRISEPGAWCSVPRWSPDGRRIAWVRGGSSRQWLCVASADGSGETPLVAGIAWSVDAPSWSPDGNSIAYVIGDYEQRDLCIARVDGSHTIRLEDDGADTYQAAWSPDGSRIALSSNRGGACRIWTVHPDGTGLTNVSDP